MIQIKNFRIKLDTILWYSVWELPQNNSRITIWIKINDTESKEVHIYFNDTDELKRNAKLLDDNYELKTTKEDIIL